MSFTFNIIIISQELELYNPDYLDKPMALIVNKMDTPGATEVLAEIQDKLLNINGNFVLFLSRCATFIDFDLFYAIFIFSLFQRFLKTYPIL